MTAKNLAIQLMIDQAEETIRNLERCRLVHTIASHNHVVLSASDFALDFDFQGNGDGTKTATRANITPLWKAPQFTKRDAQTLAAASADGRGQPSKAVFINDAVDIIVSKTREHIETLRALAAA